MNKFEFYKELYFKEEEKKTEINNSLTLPISIITAVIAANFYFTTNFSYTQNNFLTAIFLIITGFDIYFLIRSVYHIIKSYTNFHNGYSYKYLADVGDLNNYDRMLREYYIDNPEVLNQSDEEFEQFILVEIIKNTDTNQKNNKLKSYNRYKSQNFLITAILVITLAIIPFSINFCIKNSDEEIISIELDLKKPYDKSDKILISNLILKSNEMTQENNPTPPPKPTPPPSQIIKEGQNPTPRPSSPKPAPKK